MFWILRRTGAVNFFNSLNNNCGSSKGGNGNTNDKYDKRPPRKAYGRLSADSDDAVSMQHTVDDPFDDIDNYELIAPGSGACGRAGSGHGNGNGCDPVAAKSTGTAAATAADPATNVCQMNGATDCQGNYVDATDVCDLALDGIGCRSSLEAGGGVGVGVGVGSKPNSSRNQKELNENTISRLQAMVMSDDDDYDESLTCNVCDRAFHCHRQLASHQQKKRHFGCSGCDSLFPSLMLLEHHKEEFEHWSDDEISRRVCCRRNRGDDYFTDTDSYTSDAESEDLERLL